MTETEEAQMIAHQFIEVDNATDASRIAGFPVAVPTYIPADFTGGLLRVSYYGITEPAWSEPEFDLARVEQTYQWREDEECIFELSQYDFELSLSGGEPAEFCGHSGQRVYRYAVGIHPPRVTLTWYIDGRSYILNGDLYGPIDEETLVEIACSVAVP